MYCKTSLVLFILKILLLAISVDSQSVVGGYRALHGEFPYMAALGWKDENGNIEFLCGGMVVAHSGRWVLTAAHCINKKGKQPDIAFLGGEPLDEYPRLGNLTFTVKSVVVHPKYDPTQAYHDIALVELDFKFTDYTGYKAICLWRRKKLTTNDTIAIGYGLTEFAGKSSKYLLKVELKVFPNQICAPFYKRQKRFKSGLVKGHICAGDKDEIKDTCQGDSGGPLIIKHNDESYAVGITSSGQACSGYPPAIYTKISPYRKWILKVLRSSQQWPENCFNEFNKN